MPFWISVLMTELPNKIENKDNKYVLWSKMFWNKYARKNTFRTEEYTPGEQLCPQGNSSFPLYVPSIVINWNRTKPFRHVPNIFHCHSHARTGQFSIRMRIRANHSGTYRTVFILIHMHVPNHFWLEWKSELNQTTKQFSIQMKIRAQSNR